MPELCLAPGIQEVYPQLSDYHWACSSQFWSITITGLLHFPSCWAEQEQIVFQIQMRSETSSINTDFSTKKIWRRVKGCLAHKGLEFALQL